MVFAVFANYTKEAIGFVHNIAEKLFALAKFILQTTILSILGASFFITVFYALTKDIKAVIELPITFEYRPAFGPLTSIDLDNGIPKSKVSQAEGTLAYYQNYDVYLTLTVPTNNDNYNAGVIEIFTSGIRKLQQDHRKEQKFSSTVQVLFPYTSHVIQIISSLIKAPLILTGFIREETPFKTKLASFSQSHSSPLLQLDIYIDSWKIVYYDAKISFEADLRGIQYFTHYYPITTYFLVYWATVGILFTLVSLCATKGWMASDLFYSRRQLSIAHQSINRLENLPMTPKEGSEDELEDNKSSSATNEDSYSFLDVVNTSEFSIISEILSTIQSEETANSDVETESLPRANEELEIKETISNTTEEPKINEDIPDAIAEPAINVELHETIDELEQNEDIPDIIEESFNSSNSSTSTNTSSDYSFLNDLDWSSSSSEIWTSSSDDENLEEPPLSEISGLSSYDEIAANSTIDELLNAIEEKMREARENLSAEVDTTPEHNFNSCNIPGYDLTPLPILTRWSNGDSPLNLPRHIPIFDFYTGPDLSLFCGHPPTRWSTGYNSQQPLLCPSANEFFTNKPTKSIEKVPICGIDYYIGEQTGTLPTTEWVNKDQNYRQPPWCCETSLRLFWS